MGVVGDIDVAKSDGKRRPIEDIASDQFRRLGDTLAEMLGTPRKAAKRYAVGLEDDH